RDRRYRATRGDAPIATRRARRSSRSKGPPAPLSNASDQSQLEDAARRTAGRGRTRSWVHASGYRAPQSVSVRECHPLQRLRGKPTALVSDQPQQSETLSADLTNRATVKSAVFATRTSLFPGSVQPRRSSPVVSSSQTSAACPFTTTAWARPPCLRDTSIRLSRYAASAGNVS